MIKQQFCLFILSNDDEIKISFSITRLKGFNNCDERELFDFGFRMSDFGLGEDLRKGDLGFGIE